MNKKAFTLIELIMVIVILGVIAMIAVPTINSILKDSKTKAYNEQVDLIIDTTKTYMSKNSNELPNQVTNETTCITIDKIQKAGLLSMDKLQNPNYVEDSDIANEKYEFFEGAVKVTWNGKKYKYEYKDSATCA